MSVHIPRLFICYTHMEDGVVSFLGDANASWIE